MLKVDSTGAIIFPKKGKHSPRLGPVAVIAGIEIDLFQLCELFDLDSGAYQKLFTSRLYPADPSSQGISLAGPVVGAPYAVMVLETLIAWGARKIIFLGWCGSISDKVKIGDIIVATSAIIDEGTSGHYENNETRVSFPAASMLTTLKDALRQNQADFHNGAIWSTDAIYRETGEKVKYFQRQDAIGVEMEISALFTVAKFRSVDLAAMAVVSDELSSFKWRPGFKMDEFKHGRKTACTVIKDLCRKM
jgi:uridine phosphorylase